MKKVLTQIQGMVVVLLCFRVVVAVALVVLAAYHVLSFNFLSEDISSELFVISPDKIEFTDELGKGAAGVVWKGVYRPGMPLLFFW